MGDNIRIEREMQGEVRIKLAHHWHALESSAFSRGDFALALAFPQPLQSRKALCYLTQHSQDKKTLAVQEDHRI